MNIGIDVSILKANLTGMGIYIKEMVEYFSCMDKRNTYFLFSNGKLACELNVSEQFNIIKVDMNPHIVWLQLCLPRLLRKYKIEVFWQPAHILPPKVKGIDYYVTVHDLSAYKLHNVAMKKAEIIFNLFLKKTCQEAKKIIAISNYTKKDIVDALNIDPKKIEVVYNGGSPYAKENYLDERKTRKCMEKYGIEKPYFLFVGTINPRKNILTIIKAFNEFKSRNVIDCQLVIAGEYGWNSNDVLKSIKFSEYKKDIIVTGYVSEVEKEALYRHAECFIFISLLEGFGFPVLEAMSVGIPTILSNVTSLPEVGGEAAFYINDLYDYVEVADRMFEIINMSADERNKIAQKGYEQVSLFNRRECAEKTLYCIGAKSINR